MSDSTTKRMLAIYEQMGAPLMFLSGFFRSPAENFHSGESVEIDITRSDEDVSVVVTDLSTGYRMNADDLYTNKEFKPPIHMEAFAVNSHDLLKRAPGANPFEAPNIRANIVRRVFSGMTKVEAKIRRAVELQASQILQTGTLTLANTAGDNLFTMDFSPKTSHFVTAAVSWATATGKQKLDHLAAVGEQIRNDGLQDPNRLLMGTDAFENFVSDTTIQARLDVRRLDLGSLGMGVPRGAGGTFQGIVQIGNYKYEIWTYAGRYVDPATGTKTRYLDPGKIVIMASGGRLDATFGAIPNIAQALGATNGRLLREIPGRMSSGSRSMDLHTNVWLTPDGTQLMAGVGARPLLIPTAIDTYGCLDTQL